MVVIDWSNAVAQMVLDQLALASPAPTRAHLVLVIRQALAATLPFKPDVAYMEVPRCDHCWKWLRHSPPEAHGTGACVDRTSQSSTMFGRQTDSDYGCVRFESKADAPSSHSLASLNNLPPSTVLAEPTRRAIALSGLPAPGPATAKSAHQDVITATNPGLPFPSAMTFELLDENDLAIARGTIDVEWRTAGTQPIVDGFLAPGRVWSEAWVKTHHSSVQAEAIKSGVARGIRFILSYDPPWVVHRPLPDVYRLHITQGLIMRIGFTGAPVVRVET